MFRDDFLKDYFARVDAQIRARKAKPEPGKDRRQEQKPLPEGMEERRKLTERRTSRQGVREQEKENE